ncbi:hypothetical protein ACTFIR_006454 [Dictyostelium discoideum]
MHAPEIIDIGQLFIYYYIIVWVITLSFKIIYKCLPSNLSKIKFKNFFFKLDYVISIFSLILLSYAFFYNGRRNISLFKILKKENILEYPKSLGVVEPIISNILGIAFNFFKLKTIKKYTIKLNEIKKTNNNQDQQQVSKEIQSYSYGSNFKKLIISILSISWIILPWYTFKYFGFYNRFYYESFNNRTNPIIAKDSFGILMFGFQLLISTFSIIVMEISKIL